MSIADKLITVSDNMSKVYEAGQKSEYDKFWDNFQNNGNRINYDNAFTGYGFNNQNFYPKYDIRPTGAYAQRMFYAWSNIQDESLKRINLKERLEECGVVLDLSQATNVTNTFCYIFITELPVIDLSSVTTSNLVFAYNYGALKKIEKLIVSENTVFATNWFKECGGLISMPVEGTIAKSNFDISPCKKLSGESIVSIIEALSDTTSGLTVTLSQTAVDNMTFPITGNKGTYNSWTELEQTKTNWTISLV